MYIWLVNLNTYSFVVLISISEADTDKIYKKFSKKIRDVGYNFCQQKNFLRVNISIIMKCKCTICQYLYLNAIKQKYNN